jgi:hypothetical protein
MPVRTSTVVTVANSPTALATSVLGREARNRDPSSREPERNVVEIERRSMEMCLLTLRIIRGDAENSTPVQKNLGNSVVTAKRMLLIDIRKKSNRPSTAFPGWGKSRTRHTKVMS